MERTPFDKNVSLRAYINKGKDLNISKNNVSLIEHILRQKFNDATIEYTVTRLVAHPNCVVDKSKIQSLLYKKYPDFKFSAIKTDEEKSAFINRFDLLNNVLIAPNSGERPREVNYSIGWIQFFLLGEQSFHLFDWAKKYHSEYREGLKAIDTVGSNVWHTLFYAVFNMSRNEEAFNKFHEKIIILFNDYPEGLEQRNNLNETPCEMLRNIIKQVDDKDTVYMKKALSTLEYIQLQSEIVNPTEQKLNNKLKI